MTGREWQPGDVARIVSFGGLDTAAIWTGDFWVWVPRGGDGPFDGVAHAVGPREVRPLAVIDLESAEEMERLAAAWEAVVESGPLPDQPMTMAALRMRAALREFASPTPQKPDEPTGLGAVVEDRDGVLWARSKAGGLGNPWHSDEADWVPWSAINAVKVVRDGYKPGEPSC